jgi:hypothetical protein
MSCETLVHEGTLINVSRDIAVGRKILAWARQTL